MMKLEKPSIDQVNLYLAKRETLQNYVLQENALEKLFKWIPNNNDINDVLLKSSTLNDFYSTNIFNIYAVAQHILTIPNLDERLKQGDLELVDEIKAIVINGKQKKFYSFATKYCCHHNPERFPIYDSYVDKILIALNKAYPFANFKQIELKNYKRFNEVLVKFQKEFGLETFSLRELDTYLWLLGKELFQKF
ncbi:hypothetical protein JFL47_07380 [Haemophilus haemoglobinophilus]|nr:hypothetical protein [Canicola haemoglobinophilus]